MSFLTIMSSNPRSRQLPDRFPLFPKLPPELRIYIWELSLLPPRIIFLEQFRPRVSQPTSSALSHDSQNDAARLSTAASQITTHELLLISTVCQNATAYRSQCRAPATLFACHESRTIAEKSYTKAFGSAGTPASTWIDFKKDILCLSFDFCTAEHKAGLDTNRCFYEELSHDIKRVKHLAISGVWSPGSQAPWHSATFIPLVELIKIFGNLETLFLVDARHAADCTTDLVLADEESPSGSAEVYDALDQSQYGFEDLFDYSKWLRAMDPCVVASFPRIEFRTLITKPDDLDHQEEAGWRCFRRWKTLSKLSVPSIFSYRSN